MEIETGSILTGKVTGIAKFGAFVSLPSGKSGLVHISEIANTFVGDVHDFLKEGQEVRVKVLSTDASGKINLSVRQASPEENQPKNPAGSHTACPRPKHAPHDRPSQPRQQERTEAKEQPAPEESFEDKLKKFMHDSDSKISDSRIYAEKRTSRRKGRN